MIKLFKVADIRSLEWQVARGEISYSRMVEIINEKASEVSKDFILWAYENNWHRLYCRINQTHAWVNIEKNPVYTFGSDQHYAKIIKDHGITTNELHDLYSTDFKNRHDDGK